MNQFKFWIMAAFGLFSLRAISDGIAGFTTPAGTTTADNLIGSNADSIIGRKYTLASGNVVVRGQVIGKITASGKVAKALSASADGSQTPYGIAEHDCDASAGDKDLMVYESGNFNENAIVLGTGLTLAGVRASFLAGGRINLETPVKQYP